MLFGGMEILGCDFHLLILLRSQFEDISYLPLPLILFFFIFYALFFSLQRFLLLFAAKPNCVIFFVYLCQNLAFYVYLCGIFFCFCRGAASVRL